MFTLLIVFIILFSLLTSIIVSVEKTRKDKLKENTKVYRYNVEL